MRINQKVGCPVKKCYFSIECLLKLCYIHQTASVSTLFISISFFILFVAVEVLSLHLKDLAMGFGRLQHFGSGIIDACVVTSKQTRSDEMFRH